MINENINYIKLNKNPWPEYSCASYRNFLDNEKHIERKANHFVLIFMLERTLFFSEEREDIILNKGEWYVQMPNLLQMGRKGSPAPSYFYIHFDAVGEEINNMNDISGQYQEDKSLILIKKRGTYDIKLLKPMFDQLNYYDKNKAFDLLSQQSIFLSILKHIAYFHQNEEGSGIGWQVTSYIKENYNKEISQELLAKHFHFSSEYIGRKVKNYCGLSPYQYLTNYRITRAKELLANTNHTLSYITSEIGLKDSTVFYKAFKKQTGISPGEWRKISRGI